MRSWVLILLAILFGLALGLGGTVLELGASPSGTVAHDFALSSGSEPVDLRGPHAVVEKTDFDFGTMERGVSMSHTFLLKNIGSKPLTLEKGSVSCGLCITGVHFSKPQVPLGEASEVMVTWKATSMGPFRHTADVETNDSSRPHIQFTITGKVLNSYRVSPEELVFSSASATDPSTAELRIYSYRSSDLEVVGHKFLDRETADQFDVRVEPMPDAELDEDPDAKSGVVAYVTAKPGLPAGPFRQRLELRVNMPGDPVVDVPISGKVNSDVQVIGAAGGWNSDTGVLSFGTVSRREGAKAELVLQARGAFAKDLKPALHSTKPDLLKVTFGERQEIAGGHLVRVPMTVEIPVGSHSAVHLGNKQGEIGEIVIDTGHPEAKTMRLLVRFAVGE